MELTKERSEQLASALESIQMMLMFIDLDYAKAIAAEMWNNANRMDSLAALNPRYRPEKSNLQRTQVKMLQAIIDYCELGKEVDQQKRKIQSNEAAFDQIAAMFE